MHCLRGFIYESLVSAGGIKPGIDPGARTEIEPVRSCRHQTQCHFLVAHPSVSSRGQNEFVVLLSAMHAVALREQSRSAVCYCQFGKGRLHGTLVIQTIGGLEHAVCHAPVKATSSTFGTLIGILIVFMQ
jgi:hypothetical protein